MAKGIIYKKKVLREFINEIIEMTNEIDYHLLV